MSDKILFVDDELHILDSMRRQLRKRFKVVTAEGGQEALEKFKTDGPFSVVVSDMRMPGMDGVELLSRIKEEYPDTVRMMLTGNADQETATEAVNKGQIFRFLNKPCPIPVLVTSLALALRQYKLLTAEKELLDETLKGSVQVLSELMSFTNSTAFSSCLRIRSLVVHVGEALSVQKLWQLEIAALMSQIGCVTLPADILNKVYANVTLEPEEVEMYQEHPANGARMLERIPRLEGVAAIIRNQFRDYCSFDPEDLENEETNLGAQILRTVFDYDLMLFQGVERPEVIRKLLHESEVYNPDVVAELRKYKLKKTISDVLSIQIKDLAVGMIVEEDILSAKETLLAPKGQEITWPVLQGLKNFARQVGVKEPIRVRMQSEA
ncbi:MAG: response regulator [Desulfobulbaceae bacterium]|nr:MAG: response regulator [Desulfobulbaceae bacterium]